MGLETNFNFKGFDFTLRTPSGLVVNDAPFAIVQWESGYDPKYRPLSEWTQTPVLVSWTGWYQRDYPNVGQGVFGSNGTLVSIDSPLYIFIDFGASSSAVPEMYGQAWMGQVTDTLVLTGGTQSINLNLADLRSVVGADFGTTLISQDFNTWTPQAVPEPSYAGGAVLLFAVVVAQRFKKRKVEAQ